MDTKTEGAPIPHGKWGGLARNRRSSPPLLSGGGWSKLSASLGHAGGRRVVLGHSKYTVICDHQKNLILFSPNLGLCSGLHSQPSRAECGLRATGWTPLLHITSRSCTMPSARLGKGWLGCNVWEIMTRKGNLHMFRADATTGASLRSPGQQQRNGLFTHF